MTFLFRVRFIHFFIFQLIIKKEISKMLFSYISKKIIPLTGLNLRKFQHSESYFAQQRYEQS